MIFGDRVTELREKLMLTQEEIASSIGVSVNTVDNWEHGLTSPQKSNLQALAKALQTTTDYLEGKTEISTDYLSIGNKCIICGKSIPRGIAKCPECSWRKWPASFLTSPEQAPRRKRSHGVILSSLDREKARATFTSVTSYGVRTYETSLDMCTCPDFEERRKPCKHIFRLADELGLMKSERFSRGERDYTMEFTRYESAGSPVEKSESIPQEYAAHSEPVKELPAVTTESLKEIPITETAPAEKKSSGIFTKLLKYALCCFFGFWAVAFTLLAVRGDKPAMCFPVAFVIAGILTAMTAKRKGEKSAFKWWIYGALVPIVSWIDAVMLNSENRAKAFMKGVAYSLVGLIVFLVIFANFLRPA